MPSTEFMLYLVIILFILYVVMNYNKDQTHEDIQYKYIPVYRSESESKKQSNTCNNPRCVQSGKCVCGNNQNVNINNVSVNEESWGGGYGGGYGPRGPGGPNGPGGPGAIPPPRPGPGGIGGPGGPGGLGGLGGPGIGPGIGPGGPNIDPLRKFDYDAVFDEFTPPFRRSYHDDNNYVMPMALMPYYSRSPGRFRKVGTLKNSGSGTNDKYHFLTLMGREKYSNRDCEFYAISVDAENKIKFYIETKGKEINDGDIVTIPQLPGQYIFFEDEDLSPKYDPYFV